MPNHCENDLYIYGHKQSLEEIAKFLEKRPSKDKEDNKKEAEVERYLSPLDYNNIIPYPKEFRDLDEAAHQWEKNERKRCKKTGDQYNWSNRPKDGFNQGGYDWCLRNWDTKWNAYDVVREVRKRSLFYSWQSAWGPPIKVITQLAVMFPHLRFVHKFFEHGCAFQGRYVYENGELVEQEDRDYHGNRGG